MRKLLAVLALTLTLAFVAPTPALAAGSPQTYSYPANLGNANFNHFAFSCAHDATCNGNTVVTHVAVNDLLDFTGVGTTFVVLSGNSVFVCVRACDLKLVGAGVVSLDPRDYPPTALLALGHLGTEGTVRVSFTD